MYWTWELLFVVLGLGVVAVPVGRILARLGYSPWLAIVAFIPAVNLIGLWWLAYAPWSPNDRG